MIHKIISAKQNPQLLKIDFVGQKKYAPKNFARIKNVKIIKECSMICDENFIPIDFCMNELLYWYPSWLKHIGDASEEIKSRKSMAKDRALSAPKKNVISLKTNNDYVYLMHTFGWYAYGHLFDTLQRLYPLREQELRSPQYLCCDYRRVNDFALHLNFLGIDQNNLLSFNRWDVIEVPNLVVSFSPSQIAHFTYDTMNWFRSKYLDQNTLFRQYTSIRKDLDNFILYLDREHTGRRSVLNNSEVIDTLAGKNHNVYVYKGHESLLETIWLFNNARVVIGGHGAAFINTIFCQPETLILEFCPANRVYQSIVHMPKPSVNHDLIIVDADEKSNIRIDVDYVDNRMQELTGK